MPKLKVLEKSKLKEPKMFKVILLNDDVTTMDFVIEVLINIFYHDFETANKIMLEVHLNGSGICGIYFQSKKKFLMLLNWQIFLYKLEWKKNEISRKFTKIP